MTPEKLKEIRERKRFTSMPKEEWIAWSLRSEQDRDALLSYIDQLTEQLEVAKKLIPHHCDRCKSWEVGLLDEPCITCDDYSKFEPRGL